MPWPCRRHVSMAVLPRGWRGAPLLTTPPAGCCGLLQMSERLHEAIRSLQALVNDLRAACEEVGSGASRAKREVDGSRQGLKAALRCAPGWGHAHE